MSKKVINASIVDNIPICGLCGSNLNSQTSDYKLVEVDGNKYTEFIKRCSNKKCGVMNQYLSDIKMDKTVRFTVDEDNILEIKSEREEG